MTRQATRTPSAGGPALPLDFCTIPELADMIRESILRDAEHIAQEAREADREWLTKGTVSMLRRSARQIGAFAHAEPNTQPEDEGA